MIRLFVLVMAVLLLRTSAGASTWVTYDLPGGSVQALVADPTTPTTLYAAGPQGRGVLKSTNGGAMWAPANSGLSNSTVLALVLDEQLPSQVFAATTDGVFVTTDGAATWTAATTALGYTQAIAIDPSSGTLYAATQSGIWKSLDNGITWGFASTGIPNGTYITTIAVDRAHAGVVYVGSRNAGVFKTVDSGTQWQSANTGLSDLNIHTIAIDPSSPNVAYAASEVHGIFKTSDSATSWASLGGQSFGSNANSIAIDPFNPNTLYAGTYLNGVFKSADGGATWSCMSQGLPAGASISDLTFAANDSFTIYAATVAGVYKTTNAGTSWGDANAGVGGAYVLSLSADPLSPGTLYAATYNGIFRTSDWGQHWVSANGGIPHYNVSGYWDGGSAKTWAIAPDPISNGTVYAGPDIGGIFKSVDGGQTWHRVNGNVAFVRALAIHPLNNAIVYAGMWYGGGIVKSTDGGATWTPASSGLGAAPFVNALAVDPGNLLVAYAGANDGIFKTTNGGLSWTKVSGSVQNLQLVQSIAVDPTNSQRIFATGGNGVWKSSDGGATWHLLPAPFVAYVIALDPNHTNTLVAVGSSVYWSKNGGDSWTELGLPSPTFPEALSVAISPSAQAGVFVGSDVVGRLQPVCGDGVLDDGEQCDDAGTANGDGCSASCSTEAGWSCVAQPSVCSFCGDGEIIGNEECDAGAANSQPSSCCTTSCTTIATPLCQGQSASSSVGPTGGEVQNPTGTVLVSVQAGTFVDPTTVTIAGGRTASDFGVGNTAKNLVRVADFGPSGVTFSPPVTLTFSWPDANNNGVIDGTSIREKNLKVFHNGVLVSGTTTCGAQACTATACCDQVANTWTVVTSGFSEFAVGTDPCTPMAPGANLKISKVAPPTGDDALTLTGSFTLPPPVGPTLNPLANGLEVRLLDGDTSVIDVELPAGAYNATTKTGWKVNGMGTVWTFINATPTTTGGIFKVVVKDQSKKAPGLVSVQAKGKTGAYAVSNAVEVDVVLPDSGQCFGASWANAYPAGPSCVVLGTTLKCK